MVLKEPKIFPMICCIACNFNFDVVRALIWIKISSNFTGYVLYSSNMAGLHRGMT